MTQPRLPRFQNQHDSVSHSSTDVLGHALLYRLDITPEEQQMQALLRDIEGMPKNVVVEQGLRIENARRQKYIDGLDAEIKKFRSKAAQLTESAKQHF